jgi:hypothetical protein
LCYLHGFVERKCLIEMNYFNKIIILLLAAFTQACAHKPFPKPDENVAVLNLVRQSYVKGCVDAHHVHKKKKVYFDCQEMSKQYVRDISEIIK